MAFTHPTDPSFYLDDGATTYAPAGGGLQTVYGHVGGAARIFNFGASPWYGFAAYEPGLLDLTTGDETYHLSIVGNTEADFSGTSQELAPWTMRALNPQDPVAVSNVYEGTVYPYGRLEITVNGTSPQIKVLAFLHQQTAGDEPSLGEALTKQVVLSTNIYSAVTNLRSWMAGTATGGPNDDGLYPLSDGLGNTVLVKSPARMSADVSNITGTKECAICGDAEIPEEGEFFLFYAFGDMTFDPIDPMRLWLNEASDGGDIIVIVKVNGVPILADGHPLRITGGLLISNDPGTDPPVLVLPALQNNDRLTAQVIAPGTGSPTGLRIAFKFKP